MPECRTIWSGTGMNKNADAGTNSVPGDQIRYQNASVPDWDTGYRKADAGGIGPALSNGHRIF